MVLVEKHRVLQILIKLVRNAKHALTDGGRDDKELTLRVTHDVKKVSLSVIDNGIGIPTANLTPIFRAWLHHQKRWSRFRSAQRRDCRTGNGRFINRGKSRPRYRRQFHTFPPARRSQREKIHPNNSPTGGIGSLVGTENYRSSKR